MCYYIHLVKFTYIYVIDKYIDGKLIIDDKLDTSNINLYDIIISCEAYHKCSYRNKHLIGSIICYNKKEACYIKNRIINNIIENYGKKTSKYYGFYKDLEEKFIEQIFNKNIVRQK
jgi:hypothetical protein